MSGWPTADKRDIDELAKRLNNTEIAIGLILAELSKQIDAKEVLEGALIKAHTPTYPPEVADILGKIKMSVNTSLNLQDIAIREPHA